MVTGPGLCPRALWCSLTNQMYTRTCLHSRCLCVIMVFSYNYLFPVYMAWKIQITAEHGPWSQVKFCHYRITVVHLHDIIMQINLRKVSKISSLDFFFLKGKRSVPIELGRIVIQQLQHRGRTDGANRELGRNTQMSHNRLFMQPQCRLLGQSTSMFFIVSIEQYIYRHI